ncbi:hypothetical protein [Streptomyces sp. NBC_01618]|uniref:hypothetical protein n=1 Tax=Streptomyces sp. NBC_01618 TaxID=2975900 RepID=UPI00386FBE54|nr:hypothetical protein OH735_32325 [Streptomyces sp. NBC_01618]
MAFAPYLNADPSDAAELIVGYGSEAGLDVVGEAHFRGHGQGRSPSSAADAVRAGHYASRLHLPGTAAERLAAALTALPEPDRPRADPRYRLLALRRSD